MKTTKLAIVTIFMSLSFFAFSQSIDAGNRHSMVLCENGSVWTCGENPEGVLGIGNDTLFRTLVPLQVVSLSNIIAVSAGPGHNLALRNDGTVWSWGGNTSGALGNGTTETRHSPVQVTGLTNVISVSAGADFSLALKNDGTVWAWGDGFYGELGDSSSTDQYTPVRVLHLTNITAISAGFYHALALKDDGTVWAWGRNESSQLGDSTSDTRKVAVKVYGLTDVTAISAGAMHSLALKSDGTVWAWGSNDSGQMGHGSSGIFETVIIPEMVPNLPNVIAIAAGGYHCLAIKSNHTVVSWGNNGYGQLGIGDFFPHSGPQEITTLSGISQIAAGEEHSLALSTDSTIKGFGWDRALGDGDSLFSDKHTPVLMQLNCPAVVGVEVIAKGTSQIYPNPNNGAFTLETDFNPGIIELEVNNSIGEKMIISNISGESKHQFNLNSLSPGLYFLRLYRDDTVENIKFIVE